jgi:hypothetical protein
MQRNGGQNTRGAIEIQIVRGLYQVAGDAAAVVDLQHDIVDQVSGIHRDRKGRGESVIVCL